MFQKISFDHNARNPYLAVGISPKRMQDLEKIFLDYFNERRSESFEKKSEETEYLYNKFRPKNTPELVVFGIQVGFLHTALRQAEQMAEDELLVHSLTHKADG